MNLVDRFKMSKFKTELVSEHRGLLRYIAHGSGAMSWNSYCC